MALNPGTTRYWDLRTGEEKGGILVGQTFTFQKGSSKKGKRIITAKDDLLQIFEGRGQKDQMEEEEEGLEELAPMAYFRAPGTIKTLDCFDTKIAVGCISGELLHLRAPMLAPL